MYLYLAVSFKIETGLYELFTSDSYLYCLFDWGVIDEDKVTATAGAGNLVTLYFVLVLVDGSLNMWRYHIGEHCNLCLKRCGACFTPCCYIFCQECFPTVVCGIGKRLCSLLADMCVGKYIVAVVTWCKWYKP